MLKYTHCQGTPDYLSLVQEPTWWKEILTSLSLLLYPWFTQSAQIQIHQ